VDSCIVFCMFTRGYVCIYCIHNYTRTPTRHTHTQIYIYIYIYVCVSCGVGLFHVMFDCLCVCVYVCICVDVDVHIYMSAHFFELSLYLQPRPKKYHVHRISSNFICAEGFCTPRRGDPVSSSTARQKQKVCPSAPGRCQLPRYGQIPHLHLFVGDFSNFRMENHVFFWSPHICNFCLEGHVIYTDHGYMIYLIIVHFRSFLFDFASGRIARGPRGTDFWMMIDAEFGYRQCKRL